MRGKYDPDMAVRRGYKAFILGYAVYACPYRLKARRLDWLRGWGAAMWDHAHGKLARRYPRRYVRPLAELPEMRRI